MAGTDLYWARGEVQLVRFAEALGAPVFTNGQARGCIPADHDLAFSRVRSKALKEADVALVVGVPLDFRLGFGGSFGEDTAIVTLQRAPFDAQPPRKADVELVGDVGAALAALASGVTGAPAAPPSDSRAARGRGCGEGRAGGGSHERPVADPPDADLRRADERAGPRCDRDLRWRRLRLLCRPGGRPLRAGTWLDPGPFGCLGAGPGYALAAKLAHPDREVVVLYGDGAFGFSAIEYDTLVRHGVHVVGVMGNNGIWALEKHPMEFLYGYAIAADLQPETRYDQLVEALGGRGEFVKDAGGVRPALERALSAGGPALVNIATDPDTKYPRKANLG